MTTTSLPNIDHFTARDVADLVGTAAWPSVTLLLDTTAADRMTPQDATRLRQLVDDAVRQLAAKGALGATRLASALRSTADRAASMSTGRGLVVVASRATQRFFRLPDPVAAEAVVEETFRTRELLQTLHRTPPHLLLLVQPTVAQLYRVYADTLTPLADDGFPVQLASPARGRLQAGEEQDEAFLRLVDRRLAHARRRQPSPLMLAGDKEQVGRLVRRSRNLHRLAGVLTGDEIGSTTALYLAAKASLEEYLRAQQDEALLLLDEARRERPAAVRAGIEAAWEQVTGTGSPLMLVVEEGYRFPAVTDGRSVRRLDWVRTPEVAPPGAHTDLVDDLIERVIDKGGWVAFAADGSLGRDAGVALVLRTR